MEENQAGKPHHFSVDRIVLVCTWDLVWYRILSFYPMALGGEESIGVSRYAHVVHEIPLRPFNRIKLESDAGRLWYSNRIHFGFGGFYLSKLQGLQEIQTKKIALKHKIPKNIPGSGAKGSCQPLRM